MATLVTEPETLPCGKAGQIWKGGERVDPTAEDTEKVDES